MSGSAAVVDGYEVARQRGTAHAATMLHAEIVHIVPSLLFTTCRMVLVTMEDPEDTIARINRGQTKSCAFSLAHELQVSLLVSVGEQ